ncbi:MAG: transporter substrate-binding domain-containing protein [Paracoccus denitrificans]|uniref:Transporter substrate-binding domain-containing protein n=1 Tax=Paracoccus denitrificans TaxID=266 RepID=A0A533I3Y9_PARDE|nr:MAG: transporter substrate-binding domain-containing protein [Paracoccus denitrificans]
MITSKTLSDQFAPTGVLRVALNHGNPVLVRRDATGQPQGVSVELARLLASRLELELSFVEYERAYDVSSSAESNEWDVCFLAVDLQRARTIAFTHPYLQIEGCYLAGPQCAAVDSDALVESGVPVGVVKGSAYCLTLKRKPGADHLVEFDNISAALGALDSAAVAAIGGIGAVMEKVATQRPGSRVLKPAFMNIRQSMATPQGRPDALAELEAFLADTARQGVIGDILELHGIERDSALHVPPTKRRIER